MTLQKLLIIHQGALGDFVAIFPAIYRLQASFNRIDAVCQSQLGKLAQYLDLVTRWYPLEDASIASLYSNRPDQRIKALLQPYAKVVLFSFSSELEQALNQITQNRCVRFAPKPPADQLIHVTRYAIQNLRHAGMLDSEEFNPNDLFLRVHPDKKPSRPKDPKKILLHPGSGSKRKRWPLSQFIRMASLLHTRGLKTEFILGPAEEGLLDTLQKQNLKIHLLNELLDLAALYKTAGGYIGNDSGASHLAAFMGLACIVIFGPADPARWKPNGPRVEIVRPALECLPCFETEQANCPEPKCLENTGPDTVVKAFTKVYRT